MVLLQPHTLSDYWQKGDGTDESGRRLPAGVYLVRFETGAAGAVTKTVLMR